ncbi:NAD-dependent epimerase/dehydratase family protein [Sphingomonas humi]|uniref:GDP-mannose 4,6-dehydratase n=1 Tax=Sphingomonas humi TaxID=335630 RepID=A0ABP7S2J5_9SPHN
MAKRALITGIFGFTGRRLARTLHSEGIEVHGLGRENDGTASDDLPATIHVADLRDIGQIRAAFDAARPDYVIHLAGIAHVAHGDLEEMYLANIVGTRNLLEGAAGSASSVEHVIVASSANVYGNHDLPILDEDTPLRPANDYGVSKVSAELVAATYTSRVPLTVVRPFNYTGVGQARSFLIPKIVAHFRERAQTIELGNIDVARDFSDVRDVCQIYRRLLGRAEAVGTTVNICSGRPITLREVLDHCSDLTGQQVEIRVNPAFVRANEVRSLAGSTDRLLSIIGPFDRIPFRETLRWMLEAA